MQSEIFISLAAYFIGMLGIGYYAYKKSTSNVSEYMLGGRNLHPAVASLSAGASDMSGWMLMGLPGALYVSGLVSVWIAIGLTIGAYFNYRLVAPRLRIYTEKTDDAVTIPDFLEKRFRDTSHSIKSLSALVIIVFFTLYTSAGLVAGGKLFVTSFNTDYQIGLIVTAAVVVAYTMFGGFLAVSLTDFVQGAIMFVALVLVPIVAVFDLGGPSAAYNQIASIQEGYMDILHDASLIAVISSMAWGLGYFGQPHIIVRFMAIRNLRDVITARRIGMSWMVTTVIGAVLTGLVGHAYVTANGGTLDDPEVIFIHLSEVLFHPLITGFLLAAILAAVMSTISSQLLVTSSSLTEDVYKKFIRKSASQSELVLVGRISVVAVSIAAIMLASDPNSNILTLVSNAWAGFGATFGPVILLSLYWRGFTLQGALAALGVGTLVVILWISIPIDSEGTTLSSLMYEIIPGFVAAMAAAIIVSKLSDKNNRACLETFDDMERTVSEG